MQRLSITIKKHSLIILSAFLLCWVAFAWRLKMPHAGMQAHGLLIWVQILFLLLLYGYILLTAYGLGHLFLRFFILPLSKTELILLAFLLGLSIFSMGVMIIGLIGWLNTPGIVSWLAISGSIASWELLEVTDNGETRTTGPNSPQPRSHFEILLQIMILISIPLLFVSVVSPAWDYDAMLYHLEVPRQFLAEGRIYFNPETWRSAYPFLGEMPSIIGIVFGLDPLGKLMNLTYAVLFIGSVYTFGLRFLGSQIALTATAILIGAPAFLLWATWVSVDYAWAAYEFWSIYAISLWLAEKPGAAPKWLVLAGIMSGLAASIKYLSLPTLLIVGAIVAWKSIENARRPVTESIINLLMFGFSAGVVMGAWYIKNWLSTGNPVYPLVFGGPGWDPVKNQVLNDYVRSFGTGRAWQDYLLLPLNVYTNQGKFSTIPIEIIHPALWLSIFFPFIAKPKKILNIVPIYVILCFIWWVASSQVIRFLIPVSAFAAIIAATVIETSPSVVKNILKFGLLGGFMIMSVIHQIVTVRNIGAWDYFLGQRSTAEILRKVVNNFTTISYIQDSLLPADQVLFLWDGRGYYCDERCIPDDEQSIAVSLAIDSPAPQKLARQLNESGITHIMLSLSDASWFISYHDPRGLHRKALGYFTKTFLPACGNSIFHDQDMELFEITCH